jgi:ABC-2 type transport system permease protein
MSIAKYAAFFEGAFKSQINYRLATIMGLLGSALLIFVQFCLWKVLIGSTVRAGVTLAQMVAFVAITEAVGTLTRGNFANELGISIRDGSVVMHFLRPASYQLYLFSTHMGSNTYGLLTRSLPVVIMSAILVGFPLPPSFTHLLLFVVFTLLGIIIMFELIYITGLLAFWTQATWFLSWYTEAGLIFFGGTVVPLWFYPRFLEGITVYLPFRYISFEGINYYMGKMPLSQAGTSLAMSIFWVILLFLIGKLLWRMVQKKITINGG